MFFPGTSCEHLILSCSHALSPFGCVAQLLPFSRRRSECTDIAECAGINKVELNGAAAAVERCARERSKGRTLMGGRKRTGCRRDADPRSGSGGAGHMRGYRYDWSGLGRSYRARQDGRSHSWQNGWRGEVQWQGGRRAASTFSDDTNPRSRGHGVTPSSSRILAWFPHGCSRSSVGGRHAGCCCSPCHPCIAVATMRRCSSSIKATSCVRTSGS